MGSKFFTAEQGWETETTGEDNGAEQTHGIWEYLEDGRWKMLKIAHNNVNQTTKGWDHHVCIGEQQMEKWHARPYGPLANINWWWWLQKSKQKFEETKERVKCTWGKTGASQGRDTDGIDLGYGCHKRTSEKYSCLSVSSFCSWSNYSVL